MNQRLGALNQTFVISYDTAPNSLNAGGAGSRRHWGAAHREKRMWEGIYVVLLLERKVPRGMAHVDAEVLLEFRHRNRRDAENYRPAVSKPLADALVKGGWLPDDTAEFFEMTAFKLDSGVDLGPNAILKSRVTVKLDATYS